MTQTKETALATVAPTEIVTPPQPIGLTPNSIHEAESMAELLASSSLVPDHFKGKPSDCFMAIAFGVELGIPPVTALTSIAVVKGKPTLYAATMVALILSSGKCKYFRRIKSDGNTAIYETVRRDDPEPMRYEFSQAHAKAAGLAEGKGGMYGKYAKQMLEARAKSYLARDVYPDVLHGLSSYEEIDAMEPKRAVDVDRFDKPAEGAIDAESTECATGEDNSEAEKHVAEIRAEHGDGPDLFDQMLGCKSVEELEGLRTQLAKLKGADRTKALELYDVQKKTIIEAAAA